MTEEIKPFDTSKLFKEYRELSVLNKKYCCTENRNVTEKLPLSEGEFINNWRMTEKKKIKRSECPYGGIDCAWCDEDCE